MKKLLILSGKGGTGKTTTAAALIHFAKAEAIADCDVDAPNLHLIMNKLDTPSEKDFIGGKKAQVKHSDCIACGECVNHCRFNAVKLWHSLAYINEIACEGCGVCEYVCPTKAISMQNDTAGKLFLYNKKIVFSTAELKMGRGNSGKLVTQVKSSLFNISKNKPIAIIDGSPGIGCPVIASINGVDLVLAVAEPTMSGINDLKRIVKTANILDSKIAVCVNKWDISPEKTNDIKNFCKNNNIPFTGKIPFDETISKTINKGKNPAESDGPATKAFYEIYRNTISILEKTK